MPEFLTNTFADTIHTNPWEVLLRLGTAFILGLAVAQVYRQARRTTNVSSSFATTLILLCVLIAMVTQVIGDNVARAFSLVGALSIVRFRTVVRDTEDTAYVIFAVVTGMAVGSQHLWVAIIGIVVVAIASLWIRFREAGAGASAHAYLMTLRLALGMNPEDLQGLVNFLQKKEMLSMGSSRQGSAIEYVFEIQFLPQSSVDSFIRHLNRQEGVQGVEIRRRDFEN